MVGTRIPMFVGVSALVLCFSQYAAPVGHAQTAAARAAAQAPAPAAESDAARGRYIVENVAQCGRCHSPVTADGSPDPYRALQGTPLPFGPTIAPMNWAMVAPRLSGRPPGTDAEFVRLMMTGISRTGAPPRRPMPQFHMTQADAEAVLAYLKSLGAPAAGTGTH